MITGPNNGMHEAKLADIARTRQAALDRAWGNSSSKGNVPRVRLAVGSVIEKFTPVNKRVQAMAGEALTSGALLAAAAGPVWESNALVASALGALGLKNLVSGWNKLDALREGEWSPETGGTWADNSLVGTAVGSLIAGGAGIQALEIAHESGLKAAVPALFFAGVTGALAKKAGANVPAHVGASVPVVSQRGITR